MRFFRTPVVLITASLWLGCSGERTSEAPVEEPTTDAPPEATEEVRDTAITWYDAQGQLRESQEKIAGLVLPVGLRQVRETERKKVYRTEVPIRKLLEYFGPRLFTGSVERDGPGAVYRNAQVQGVLRSSVKLDVSIKKSNERVTRVAITEIPPPPRHAPSLDETRKRASEQAKTLY